MFCVKCGSALEDNAKFCPNCGAPTGAVQPSAEPASVPVPTPTPAPAQTPGPQTAAVSAPVYAPEQPAAQPAKPPKVPKQGGRKKIVIPIVIAAVLVVLLAAAAAVYFLVLRPNADRQNIDLVKNGYLGVYTSRTVEDLLYDYYSSDYDEASWSGSGMTGKSVTLTFHDSRGKKEDVKFTFDILGKDCFKVSAAEGPGTGTSDTARARLLNRIYDAWYRQRHPELETDPVAEYAYLDQLVDRTAGTVLYGASEDYAGSRTGIAGAFGEKTPVQTSVLELLDLEQRYKELKELKASGNLTAPQGSSGNSGSPANSGSSGSSAAPASAVPSLPAGQMTWDHYGDFGDIRSATLEAIYMGDDVYWCTLIGHLNSSARAEAGFFAAWDSAAEGFVFESMDVTEYAVIDGDEDSYAFGEEAVEGLIVPADGGVRFTIYDDTYFFASNTGEVWDPVQANVSLYEPSEWLDEAYVYDAWASSTIVQDNGVTNEPMKLFDGDDTTTWQEGADGYGIGEYVIAFLDDVYGVEAISFKLGNWRSDSYYVENAMPKTMTIVMGYQSFEVDFYNEQSVQWVTFTEPIYVRQIAFIIKDVYTGTKYEDTCINEIGIWGDEFDW